MFCRTAVALMFVVTALACGGDLKFTQAAATVHNVIDGEVDPAALGFELTAAEQNAIVAQIVTRNGVDYQGCTGNVISDRMVAAAAHCVIDNQTAWRQGSDPELVAAAALQYYVGPDIDSPLCQLQVREIHLHPELRVDGNLVHNEVALMVLTESVAQSCPQLTPLEVNREALSSALRGTEMLQGGYGSLDGSYEFSPLRYWSKLGYYGTMLGTPLNIVWFDSIGSGDPSMGDSGSGILRRGDNSMLQILGVLSFTATTSEGVSHGFSRLDLAADFIDSISATIAQCDAVPAGGSCDGTLKLTCDAQGLSTQDCSEEDKICAIVDTVATCTTAPVTTQEPDAKEEETSAGCRSMSGMPAPFGVISLVALLRCRRRVHARSSLA